MSRLTLGASAQAQACDRAGDIDRDGIINRRDPDRDGDGIANVADPRPNQDDRPVVVGRNGPHGVLDRDGVTHRRDSDRDGDGDGDRVHNNRDRFPDNARRA